MISSLLSLYIASTIQADIGPTSTNAGTQRYLTVKTSNFSISQISEKKQIPIKNPEFIAPIIKANASLTMDLETGTILFEKNIHERLSIASITKLMTALIILEENELSEIATVSKNATAIGGSTMYLRHGEEITLESLMKGLLISSANDAAITLAEHNAGNTDAFVKKMNNKAMQLGLVNTHFSNPMGLDATQNYSSAYDIAKLGKYVYQKNFIKQTVSLKKAEVISVSGKYTHKLVSTNKLLDSFLKIKGLKTGKTTKAGLCFISIAENDKGHEILTVVLGSPDRFRETKILIDWIYRAYAWKD